MPQVLLQESATTLTRTGNRWKAVLAVAGTGSSGVYSEDVLREFGPKALAPGSKAFINHDPKRDPRDMFGFYPEGAVYEEGVGLVGELEVFPHYKDLIETVAQHAALSIYMLGEKDDDDNVTELLPSRMNTVDLVSFGGLEGSGIVEKLYESAIAASEQKPGVTSAQEKEGKNMEEKLDKLLALFETFVTESSAKATAAAQAEADAEAVEQAVEARIASYDEKIAAIDAAELLPSQVESLRAAAKKGDDVAPLIESAKKIVDEAKTVITESAGRTYVAEGANSDDDFNVAGWGN